VLFTPSLLFLFPALDPAFPRLDVNQAIALGLIVEFVGYSSAATAYWRQRRVAFEVAGPVLMVALPTAVPVGGQIAPRLASNFPEVFLKGALVTMFLFVGFIMIWRSF